LALALVIARWAKFCFAIATTKGVLLLSLDVAPLTDMPITSMAATLVNAKTTQTELLVAMITLPHATLANFLRTKIAHLPITVTARKYGKHAFSLPLVIARLAQSYCIAMLTA